MHACTSRRRGLCHAKSTESTGANASCHGVAAAGGGEGGLHTRSRLVPPVLGFRDAVRPRLGCGRGALLRCGSTGRVGSWLGCPGGTSVKPSRDAREWGLLALDVDVQGTTTASSSEELPKSMKGLWEAGTVEGAAFAPALPPAVARRLPGPDGSHTSLSLSLSLPTLTMSGLAIWPDLAVAWRLWTVRRPLQCAAFGCAQLRS